MSPVRPERLQLRVVASRWEAEGVVSFELASSVRGTLPPWSPGAHVDVHLPSGAVRQYSLCGDPSDTSRYRIAILELLNGRGGSVEAHQVLRCGAVVVVGVPRSDFSLVDAPRHVFVAGGIGITPLLPMIRDLARRRLTWELVYGARSARHFSFVEELQALGADRVRLYAEDTDGVPDLSAVVTESTGAAVYGCGPAGMLDALTSKMAAAGRESDLHLERFSAAPPTPENQAAFQIELLRTGVLVDVSPDQTVLDAVRRAGVDVPSSCEMGICGTCETKVLSGAVDHRDELLTANEKAQNNTMMLCVSRASCPRLVLDL